MKNKTILVRAWDIVWGKKYLWILGLFAALMASGGFDRAGNRFSEGFLSIWQNISTLVTNADPRTGAAALGVARND